ncbi:MAG: hypothetical protein HYX67_17115 [Candidatus Melainabacteria bacterium]|nr:hypothetical protein [Candidatus Melainabacteria bacterium]
MNYEWVVVNVSLAEAQEQLNALDQQKYEIFATHTFAEGGINGMSIIARRLKKPTGDVRY